MGFPLTKTIHSRDPPWLWKPPYVSMSSTGFDLEKVSPRNDGINGDFSWCNQWGTPRKNGSLQKINFFGSPNSWLVSSGKIPFKWMIWGVTPQSSSIEMGFFHSKPSSELGGPNKNTTGNPDMGEELGSLRRTSVPETAAATAVWQGWSLMAQELVGSSHGS